MKKRVVFITSVCVLIVCVLSLAIYLAYPYLKPEVKIDDVSNSTDPTPSQVTIEKPDNPIDFATLQERNSDVIGWINIPNTKVDYPILQANESLPESYYLYHNIDRDYEFAGSIYIQRFNRFDFSDPNTIIYGHNMKNGSMFATIHKFKDKAFFDENKYIYIYTPGHILTYEIFSAYRYDDRHLLFNFDFNNKDVFEDYLLNTAMNPKDYIRNTRPETNVTADDNIITLSTCITNDNYRYLVQGVLINDIETK